MSLVKEARLTPDKVKANRRNGGQPKGQKVESVLDALRGAPASPSPGTGDPLDVEAIMRSLEGIWDEAVCPRSIRTTLLAMSEDPAQFGRHHQELIDEWQPTTPTLRRLVLRLAYLMWRQERAQRAQEGIMLCRMEKEVNERSRRMLEGDGAPAQRAVGEAAEEGGLRQAAPSTSKFNQLLDYLYVLMGQLQAREFSPNWEIILKLIYGNKPTVRGNSITLWARELAEYFAGQGEAQAGRPPAEASYDFEDQAHEAREAPEGWKPPLEPIRTEAKKNEVLRNLRRELAEEHRDVTLEFKLYKSLHLDFPSYLRHSLFAPQDKYWGTVIWQEQSLAQEIERTLKMIVTLKAREESEHSSAPGAGRLAPQSRMRARTPARRQRQAMGRSK